MTLCPSCRYWGGRLAKLQQWPTVWQLGIAHREALVGHDKVHEELRRAYLAIYGAAT